jgi:hypothetical protein
MRIAFIVLAHKSATFIQRLVSRLCLPNTAIFVHVDRGTERSEYESIRGELDHFLSVRWLPRSYSHWGSWGLVQASLSGLAAAREADCDYAILLSGQDYPIKPLPQLTRFLKENQGASFLQYHRLPSNQWPPDGASRYTRWHFNLGWKNSPRRRFANRVLNRFFNTLFPNRALPDRLSPFGGWQWWCLQRGCIDYVLEFTGTHRRVVEFFKRVRVPDEMYFHTVLMNSPLSSSVQNRLFTYANWQGPPYPRTLGLQDFEHLKRSDSYFARKFDLNADAEIVDRIDRELLSL